MRRSEQERLLNEILAGEEITSFRQASLAQGLVDLRRQKGRRRLARISLLGSLPILLFAAVFSRPLVEMLVQRQSHPSLTQVSQAPAEETEVKFISDDELLALFPNRSVALIGKPGQQQLVFLDVPRGDSSP